MTDSLEILLVDDDEIDRLALKRALSKAGIEGLRVTEAEHARDAFDLITTTDFACAFFDVRLPDRDGVALLRDVRAAGVRTPVIVLTGFGDEQTVLDAMKAGATDYLAKSSVSPESIGHMLRAAMRLRDAELATSAARAAEERYAEQLRGLADAAVAVNASPDVMSLLCAAATHACRITGSNSAMVDLAGEFAADIGYSGAPSWLTATSETVPSIDDAMRVSLPGRDGNGIGDIALAAWECTQGDTVVLDQLARLVAGALENMRLYQAARRATTAREDVLAIVSHDLRNPLHTISLSVSFLTEVFGDELSDTARQQTGIIRRAVERANNLIQDLLDVSSIDAGGFAVTPEPVAPEQLLADAAEAMTPAAKDGGITFLCTDGHDLPNVRADRERVLQIFTNLVGNAIKFTERGGEIEISATPIDRGFVRFTVRDTGSGISSDNLPHVFDRFWQARTRARAGAGLGLAIAKGIVEAHGGDISVASTIGIGTEMSFTLPYA